MPALLPIVIAAAFGAVLGWWPLHRWTMRSLQAPEEVSSQGIRIATTVLTPALFGLLVWRFGIGPDAVVLSALLIFAAAAVVLAVVDVAEHRLPNVVVGPLLGVLAAALILAAALSGQWPRLLWAFGGCAAMFAVYLLLALVSPRSMGMGDVKLAAPIGLLLGWFGLTVWLSGLLAAFLCGGVVAVLMLALRRTTMRGSLPFGPSMLLGALLAVLIAG
ncbi:MAG: A24 family peptidase [Microbacterium sp.]